MMRAARYRANGSARDVLEIVELPVPDPGPGEVRVRIAYSGINPSDVKSRAGGRPVANGYVVPHSDGSGTIDAVGSGVPPGRVGERVWLWNAQFGRRDGTAAEYIALPADQAVRLPDAVALEAGASFGVPALTAAHAVALTALEPGQTVLVTGGASNVGFYACQLARLEDARVLATVGSEDKARRLRALGIEDVILYKQEDVAARARALTGGTGVQALIDLDLSSNVTLVQQGALADGARYVCYGSTSRGDVPIHFMSWLPRAISLHFLLVYTLTPAQRAAAIALLEKGLAAGLAHQPVRTFALEDIVRAHECVEAGEPGRMLIDMGLLSK